MTILGIQHADGFKCHPRDTVLLEAREGNDRVRALGRERCGEGQGREVAVAPAGVRRVRQDSISYPVAAVWQTPHKQGSSHAGVFRALGEFSGVTPRFRLL